MALNITKRDGKVLLEYKSYNGLDFMEERFNDDESITIEGTFQLRKEDLLDSNYVKLGNTTIFVIGELKDDYYEIFSKILETKFNVLFSKNYDISKKDFIVNSKISILLKFEELANQQIIIGGDKENSIPENIFIDIVNSFPTNTEIIHYKNARVTNVLSEYLEGVKDSGNAFEKYLNKRNKTNLTDNIKSLSSISKYEYEKYSFILSLLKEMLLKSEAFSETEWQSKIIEIILILYPKYIKSFSEAPLKDYYTNPLKVINRRIDLILIDSNYHLDIIEIKKPFQDCIVTKKTYRDNYTPMKELSGTVMQVEKYLFHLSKWGIEGEKKLKEKYGIDIKITNPKGILILGRDNSLTKEQKFDFEIIKRKYSNIMDIITYDDLIQRLENLLKKFEVT